MKNLTETIKNVQIKTIGSVQKIGTTERNFYIFNLCVDFLNHDMFTDTGRPTTCRPSFKAPSVLFSLEEVLF